MKSPKEVVPLKELEKIIEIIYNIGKNDGSRNDSYHKPKIYFYKDQIRSLFAETIERVITPNEDIGIKPNGFIGQSVADMVAQSNKRIIRNELRAQQRLRAKELGL